MYFKQLELIGFKSFPEKTTIHIEPGVTAIVGPNGCGKSNIADAIRWVLGEQSAKSLRGASMEDVIFSGSSAKEPVNFAEVSLTLSNESKILPIDFEEVTITRRLYRSGESEYLINKNLVRLKDISELLMGTGIGTDSYSILEQGKMDIILNSKPEDRRAIFEEAAGVTKYKSKKKEALCKLEITDNNLLRINDIIQEVKRQIGSVERQAKKAENYKVEFEKLKNLELATASREFLLFEHERKTKETSLQELKQKENEFLARVEETETECANGRNEIYAVEERLKAAQGEEMLADAEMMKNRDRISLNRERVGEFFERRESLLKQMELVKKRIGELALELEKMNSEYQRTEKEDVHGRIFLSSVEADFNALETSVNQSLAEEEGTKSRLLDIANERAHHQSGLAKIHAEQSALASRLKRLKREEESFLKEIEEAGSGPLFGGVPAADPTSLRGRFETCVREFKSKLMNILKTFAGILGAEEEARLDTEIKTFTEEVVKIQGQLKDAESQRKILEDTKQRLEEKLSLISGETEDLVEEEIGFKRSEKEHESALFLLMEEEKILKEKLLSLQGVVKDKAKEREALLVRLTQTRSQEAHAAREREKAQKDRNWVLESRSNQEAQLLSLNQETEASAEKKTALESEIVLLEEAISALSLSRDEILRKIERFSNEREEVSAKLAGLEKERTQRQAFLKKSQSEIHAYELENAELRHEIDRLKERIFNAYQVDFPPEADPPLAEAEGAASDEAFNFEEAKAAIGVQREKLNKMGPVNLVAIEECDEMKQRFDFLTQQQEDLTKAKEDLYKAIQKINRTTKELFIDTFTKIQKHFSEYHRLLFGGGSAELILLDDQDVLESGIEIVARPPGKKLQSISLLSGGEKAMTAIALLMAIFKVKPSPFCVLDEIDAPLDESNVDRFCNVLKEFIVGSQFILITHNKRTMNLADALYGITMAETGVSKIVSVRFSEEAVAV